MADDTNATDAGQRYAQALFDLAKDDNAVAPIEADLKSLKAAIRESADLRRLIESPAFDAEDKARGINAIAQAAGFHATTKKFLGLVAANRRTSHRLAIIGSFEKLSADWRGVVSAEVVTALPLSDAQSKGVAAALRTALGKDPEITTRVDPSILGGIKVLVGSRLFDASLKSRLDSLKFALKRA